ncbi:tyrosine recombinase XerC [Kribbella sp. NPDC058693]|uniref:site-specific integrase n=1 Tax=Kribbella sp. NPDC058693 TaxID=3346602 RepID=UPI003653B679
MGFTKDLWNTTVTDAEGNKTKVPTARNGKGKRWLAVWHESDGRERTKAFERKVDADRYWPGQETDVNRGTYVSPADAKTTVDEWCTTWLKGYATRRASTVRQAKTHVALIRKAFGELPLNGVRPSAVRSWCAQLKGDGYEASYVYALHARLSQIMADAVHDGILNKNPCSRRTSPGAGKQKPYCATTEQVWALYDAFPEHLRPAILLGAFVGLRTAEACGARIEDTDFMRGVFTPAVQWPAQPLKTDASKTPVPMPAELSLQLSAAVGRWGSEWLVTDSAGGQASTWSIDRAMRSVRKRHVKPLPHDHAKDCRGCLVPGLPAEFVFHDLRHYLASLLIASGADVKVVQARLRHASAKTTLDTYSHLWPDADESTRAAVGAVLAARVGSLTEQPRNAGES